MPLQSSFTSRDMRTKDAHVPALDGVRGLAIALVFARHLSLISWFQRSPSAADRAVSGVMGAGWIGVDLFFVLSGFLITGVLLHDRDRAAPMTAKLGRFYWRRTLRIMPLYYVACAILFFVVPALPYFRAQPEIAVLHQSAPWYWLYGVNILDVVHGGAWTPFNTGHFWSLAVEEQFYLVWPLVVLATSRKTLVRIVAGLIVAGPFIRLACVAFLGGAGPNAAYTLSLARVDVLGVGALLAVTYRGDHGWWARVQTLAPWCGGAALATFVLIALTRGVDASHDPVMQTIGYSAVALGMGSLLASLLRVDRPALRLGRFFSAQPLRTLGKYSYCLYIVHYPLMAVMDLAWMHVHIAPVLGSQLPSWTAYGAVLAASSFAIAWVSWRVLESPMLAMKDRFTPSPIPSAAPPSAPSQQQRTYQPRAREADVIAVQAAPDPWAPRPQFADAPRADSDRS
jgi:peptidoglycan/LPS O-acetylase OafA/YrhL